MITVLLPAAIAVIMCSLGLTLVPADFGRVVGAPRGVVIGMLNLAVISVSRPITSPQPVSATSACPAIASEYDTVVENIADVAAAALTLGSRR